MKTEKHYVDNNGNKYCDDKEGETVDVISKTSCEECKKKIRDVLSISEKRKRWGQ